jgi:formylglycine-generating enzyme
MIRMPTFAAAPLAWILAMLPLGCGSGSAAPSIDSPFTLPPGCIAAPDAAQDAATGLPSRIIHQPTGISLVLVPAGEFQMGEHRHQRTIRRPFYLGQTEITTAQFRAFADASGYITDAERGTPDHEHTVGSFAALPAGDREWNAAASWRNPWPTLPSTVHTDQHPVVHTSWNDAVAFCTHFGLSLPSEAQWEYACRAGATGTFPWGDDPAGGAGFCNVQDAAYGRRYPSANGMFPFDDGHATLAPAASQKPNAWGLYDMIGNLEEWCADDWQRDIPEKSDESPVIGAPVRAAGRVLRGGSWLGDAGICNAMSRPAFNPSGRRDFVGFRVAAEVRPAKLSPAEPTP